MDNRIKKILVDGYGWVYAEATGGAPAGEITIIKVNGEMAHVNWYKKLNEEYNGKYVVVVVYF